MILKLFLITNYSNTHLFIRMHTLEIVKYVHVPSIKIHTNTDKDVFYENTSLHFH